ncbi:putative hydroxymethylpyrimidine transporter CytX [Peptoniphilus sp. BV3AC2]|uniref:putative hydroxymethylpyrimidine transporter CytX n=1 Tax=Peptoniphilus sp. BV3AC2 TaxID=1111133 RepID=UPI0003B7F8A6|nr:putative hydroxymethylpyrimidine transporter CytX [Peptoniphilus sp. BV3AC2]ERT64918.1 putative hydroxymethylpyrimidine transporter CytX [Peptoniphilus sp. BV3AC2]
MTKNSEHALIWFGAGVSIAEMLTGTYYASLGLKNGAYAILLGHLIGFIFMYLAGYISERSEKSSMETVKITFGKKGGILFAVLNVVQLAGWTAIMIYDGALSAGEILKYGSGVWAVVIGALIVLWIVVGITSLKWINTLAMTLLFVLTIILSRHVFSGEAAGPMGDAMSFGAAVELGAAMPLSWIPVVGDYTMNSEKKKIGAFVAAGVYTIVSIWMQFIGLGAALYAGETDISLVMIKAGIGTIGLLIVVLSTVTTTFLDAYSAGISSRSILKKLNAKTVGVVVTILGTVLAMVYNMDDITGFLYLIGSVFAPMTAVLIADQLILKSKYIRKEFEISHLLSWAIGFVIYRKLLTKDFYLGVTFVNILITIAITVILNRIGLIIKKSNKKIEGK